MTDTAQPAWAAESDGIANAAQAFKEALGQAPQRPRDEQGRFASTAPEEAAEEEIEAEAEAPAEAEAESPETEEETDEAADEAQPEAIELPTSWPAEKAEMWTALPPEAQAIIAEREGQRDAAVNAKFQEAANLRKAHEAEIGEAQANRQRYAEAADLVLNLVQPQRPPLSMLDVNSDDYDPDGYHLANARYDQTVSFLEQQKAQLSQLRAQEQNARYSEINQATKDAFLKDVPEIADPAKAPALLTGLMEYAISQGAPRDMFDEPATALEFHMLWKAKKYDELMAAQVRVKAQPAPEPKKAQPAVRPGIGTPKAAVEQVRLKQAHERLAREGSIEAGAAIWKHATKGLK